MVSGTAVVCDEDTENPCTFNTCDPFTGGCVELNQSENTLCDDGDTCTTESLCKEGVCEGITGIQCNDGNECTEDLCDGGSCLHVDSTLPCDDGNLCTDEDTCDEGNCIGSTVDCEDGNFCTLVSCYAFTGCVYTPNNGVQCDDDNECTTFDTCQGTTCLGISADCDDEDPCTDDFCNPDTGLCDTAYNSAACDDGLDCTVSDYCSEGSCLGGEVTCDDGLQCTLNLCVDSECLHPIGAGQPCSDGQICTEGDFCDAEGICIGFPLECEGGDCVTGTCVPGFGCSFIPVLNGPCDDGDICTLTDECSNGECVGNGRTQCSDNNNCTDDICDPVNGCQFVPNSNPCFTGDICTVKEVCTEGA